MTNIRSIVYPLIPPNYCEINREERNYTAIFFAALCNRINAKKFLALCGYYEEPGPEFGVYFEYAYLRDLWSRIKQEETKKEIIREHLQISGIDKILSLSVTHINRLFGVSGTPSDQFIQYSGKWAIVKYHEHFPDNTDFLNICKFKWSFNIKPDIVIHLDKERAICIEAKYESDEGSYPISEHEKKIFRDREIPFVRQTELQKYMMVDLLGIETDFRFLGFKKSTSNTHKAMTWAEAFGCMNLNYLPDFAKEMVKRISANEEQARLDSCF